MKKRIFPWLILLFIFSSFFPVFTSALDNTKLDWWLVRSKDHSTPRVNDRLNFRFEDYDAYYVGDTSSPVLYLTFDEGYEQGYTSHILDVLKAKDVKAVFFVTSPYLTSNPDLIRRMADEGHIVANHSHHHPSMPAYTNDPAKFANELNDVANKYEALTGQPMTKLFRPPMGHYSEKSLAMTKDLGYKTVFWSSAYCDFDVNRQPAPETAIKLLLSNLHNGSIILLHGVSRTNAQVLGEVIDGARQMGYTFELFQ